MYALYAYIYSFIFSRIKKDRVARDVELFSTGFLQLIDKCFWNLPFTRVKQVDEVRLKFNIPETVWNAKWSTS